MALNTGNLIAVSNGPGLTGGARQSKQFMYITTDTQATVKASGYFNGATGLLTRGSVIISVNDMGATPTVSVLVVTSATDAATVTTAIAS